MSRVSTSFLFWSFSISLALMIFTSVPDSFVFTLGLLFWVLSSELFWYSCALISGCVLASRLVERFRNRPQVDSSEVEAQRHSRIDGEVKMLLADTAHTGSDASIDEICTLLMNYPKQVALDKLAKFALELGAYSKTINAVKERMALRN